MLRISYPTRHIFQNQRPLSQTLLLLVIDHPMNSIFLIITQFLTKVASRWLAGYPPRSLPLPHLFAATAIPITRPNAQYLSRKAAWVSLYKSSTMFLSGCGWLTFFDGKWFIFLTPTSLLNRGITIAGIVNLHDNSRGRPPNAVQVFQVYCNHLLIMIPQISE